MRCCMELDDRLWGECHSFIYRELPVLATASKNNVSDRASMSAIEAWITDL